VSAGGHPPKRRTRAVQFLLAGATLDFLMLLAGFALTLFLAAENYHGRCYVGGIVFGGATYEYTFLEYFRGEILYGIMLWAIYLWWAVAVALALPPLVGFIVGLSLRKGG
jgi:hypothetical protein